jgi:hypothetical protein
MSYQDIYTREILEKMRNLKSNSDSELYEKINVSNNAIKTGKNFKYLYEEYDGDYNVGTVTVTKENFPDLVEEIKSSLIQKIPNVRLENDYLQLDKNKNTLTLTGSIQNLNNLEFIITTDISNDDGLYITVEGLNITQTALQTLQILQGFSKVFINEWTINKVADTFKMT